MNTEKLNQRISKLQVELEAAKKRKRELEAKQKALASKQERARDTRRKVLWGAAVIAAQKSGDLSQDVVRLLWAKLEQKDREWLSKNQQ